MKDGTDTTLNTTYPLNLTTEQNDSLDSAIRNLDLIRWQETRQAEQQANASLWQELGEIMLGRTDSRTYQEQIRDIVSRQQRGTTGDSV